MALVPPVSLVLVASADATLASPRAEGSKVKRIVRHRGINGGTRSMTCAPPFRGALTVGGETVYAAKGRKICLSARGPSRSLATSRRQPGKKAYRRQARDNACGIVTRQGEDAEITKGEGRGPNVSGFVALAIEPIRASARHALMQNHRLDCLRSFPRCGLTEAKRHFGGNRGTASDHW